MTIQEKRGHSCHPGNREGSPSDRRDHTAGETEVKGEGMVSIGKQAALGCSGGDRQGSAHEDKKLAVQVRSGSYSACTVRSTYSTCFRLGTLDEVSWVLI